MSNRFRLALAALLLLPALALGQDKTRDELKRENERLRKLNAQLNKDLARLRKSKQKVIDDLRKRVSQAEDETLDYARQFDKEKKRLQDEKEQVLKELTKMRRDHALEVARLQAQLAQAKRKASGAKPDPLKRKISFNFMDTPLQEVMSFLTDVTGIRHRLATADAKLGQTVTVSLRLKDITLRNALNLIAASKGGLRWRRAGKEIVFSTQPPLTTSPSGLGIQDLVEGKGAAAAAGKRVTVHYVGYLKDGTVFDSSRRRGTPLTFVLGKRQVIDGWEEGLVGLKVGGKRRLVIPPGLAYGKRRVGKIPPNSTLTFDIELLEVE